MFAAGCPNPTPTPYLAPTHTHRRLKVESILVFRPSAAGTQASALAPLSAGQASKAAACSRTVGVHWPTDTDGCTQTPSHTTPDYRFLCLEMNHLLQRYTETELPSSLPGLDVGPQQGVRPSRPRGCDHKVFPLLNGISIWSLSEIPPSDLFLLLFNPWIKVSI